MRPVYDQDGITLYQGDCRDLLQDLDPSTVNLVLTDPPYGIRAETERKSRRRGKLPALRHDFPPVHGDDQPFDPSPLLRFPRLILFGANYYAERLPASPSWIVWDKLDGLTTEKREIGFICQADVEMAWTNLGGPARLVPHRWLGMLKASERTDRRVHPTQKPIALMERLIELYTSEGDLILDPYAGSGPVLIAARRTGRRAIGVEIEAHYCQVIINRLEAPAAPPFRAEYAGTFVP